jgi:hypothetical protein
VDVKAVFVKKCSDFRANEAGGAGDQTDFAHAVAGTDSLILSVYPSPDRQGLNEICAFFANSN